MNLRESMPECAAWLDALRAEFGEAEVNGWIRQGLADGTFRAQEAGQVLDRQTWAAIRAGGR